MKQDPFIKKLKSIQILTSKSKAQQKSGWKLAGCWIGISFIRKPQNPDEQSFAA